MFVSSVHCEEKHSVYVAIGEMTTGKVRCTIMTIGFCSSQWHIELSLKHQRFLHHPIKAKEKRNKWHTYYQMAQLYLYANHIHTHTEHIKRFTFKISLPFLICNCMAIIYSFPRNFHSIKPLDLFGKWMDRFIRSFALVRTRSFQRIILLIFMMCSWQTSWKYFGNGDGNRFAVVFNR